MKRRAIGLGLLAMPFMSRGATAASAVLRLSRQFGLSYLPMILMQEQRLLEAELAQRGMPATRVEWSAVAGSSQHLDGLLSGQYDFIAPGVPTLATLWDKTRGTPQEARALCAQQTMPYILVSRNPGVATVADFTDKDRIALPAVKLTGHALALEMECARRWGRAEFGRLDPLTVTLSHPDAMAQLLTPSSAITAHFTGSPFHYQELAHPGMHQVLNSYDVVGGRHTNGVLVATTKFHDANPDACAALLAALGAANRFIKDQPREAAAIYLRATKERGTVDELERMVADPDVEYTTQPVRTMVFATFMHEVGRLKRKPERWTDMFFPEAHGLAGS